MKTSLIFLFSWCLVSGIYGQDPHYSQFFMTPLAISPALAGSGYAPWRIACNYREQWSVGNTPFRTFSLSADATIGSPSSRKKKPDLSVGILLTGDESLNGAFKSSYAQTGLACHVPIDRNHKIGVGIQGMISSRQLKHEQLTFGNQFSAGGFDVRLPTGEPSLQDMAIYGSLHTGLLYRYDKEDTHLALSGAVLHINQPVQSFLGDGSQRLPRAFVLYGGYDFAVTQYLFYSINGIFREQAGQRYFASGGAVGLDISEGQRREILYAGAWYRSGDAISPYFALLIRNCQVGITYDLTLSKQNSGPVSPQSLELSIVWRNLDNRLGRIICPWR